MPKYPIAAVANTGIILSSNISNDTYYIMSLLGRKTVVSNAVFAIKWNGVFNLKLRCRHDQIVLAFTYLQKQVVATKNGHR